eukprot:jgi/Undpi1/5733/HiC_scaffold_2.g01007.m1
MMATSAVFGLIDLKNFQLFILSVYLLIFAILLFMYELVRVVMKCEGSHQIMLKNFGFFFGAKGRGLYLILGYGGVARGIKEKGNRATENERGCDHVMGAGVRIRGG